ncbi:MAG TPA: tetratricopeptide repeat protein [Candidatus Sulfotelmatobacter sp.]|nr:tetratricopeptide repeat protein [Candidatus Sulfotelmatobacter sp.]
MPEKKKEILSYFENLSLLMIGILFILFPIFFLNTTTDAFVLPKQLILIILSSLSLLIFGVRTLINGKLQMRTSPFDIPVTLLIIITFISAGFSINSYDSFIAVTPLLFVGFLYFVIVNTVKTQKQLLFLLGTLTLGTGISALLTILSFSKFYPLPFLYTHVTFFTTFGSLLDQALYYALVLPIAGYFGYGYLNNAKHSKNAPFTANDAETHRKKSTGVMGGFGIAFIVIAIALGLTVYMLFTNQKPLILPFSTGLSTAFAAISQSNNVFRSLLLGSGFGTYLNDFTQFKPASYNANQTLWAFTFFRSSSFALELMATTGLLGIATFAFLVFRIIREKNFFLPLMIAILAALILPFSFTLVALFFILLALFATVCIQNNPQRFGEAEFSLLALKRGLFAVTPEHEKIPQNASERRFSKILPSIFLIVLVIIISVPLYFVTRFMMSDFTFQQSLVAESQNNGLQTYQLQTAAISEFPYRDIYYRAFSQTNIALANAIAVNQPKGSSPSAQTQQNILTLIQQSINAGRAAVTIAPATSFNWNNLSSIYRSLIGFGQHADQFTILTLNQAIALDPNNPQQYIDLGGVYYQLGQYDNAIREFQISANLKPDYANAYYNLGHAYQQQGIYNQALAAYETVKQLVADSSTNTQKINADIDTINKLAVAKNNGQQQPLPQASPSAQITPIPQQQQQPIDVNKPGTVLPERNPKASIPAPTVSASPSNTP